MKQTTSYPIYIVTFVYLSVVLICSAVLAHTPASEKENIEKQDSFHLTRGELELWNDPSFKRQFTRSYLAQTPIEPQLTAAENEKMQEIFELIAADKIKKAENMLKENQNEASSAVIDFTLGNIHFQKEEFDKAQVSYETAVEKFPKFRRAWKNLGLVYVRRGEFSKSLKPLTTVIQLGGNDAIINGLLGVAYFNVENYLSAESAYHMAILLDPDRLEWKEGLAKTLFQQGRYTDTITFCRKLTEQYPERADIWLLQADSYLGLDKPMKAAEIYELVDGLGKSTFESLNALGDIYLEQQLYDAASNSYIRAMQIDSKKNIEAAIDLAKVLAFNGATEQSQRIIEKIKSIYDGALQNSHLEQIRKLKARIAVANGSENDQYISILRDIVKSDPLDGQALILIGNYNAHKGNTEKAIFYYERAAGIGKYEADAKVRHAELLVGKGKYAEALPLLRQAQQINPSEDIRKYLEQLERVARNR